MQASTANANLTGEEEGAAQVVQLPAKRKAEQEKLHPYHHHAEQEKEKLKGISRDDIKRAVKEYVKKHGRPPASNLNGSPYPDVPDLPNAFQTFQLHHGGMSNAKRSHAIATVKAYHAKYQANLLGYQCNQKLDFAEDFGSYLNILTNNIGDTFQSGSYTLNTKFLERAVLDYYAELWHIQYPHAAHDPESYWGFCLSMGCTEGNMYGMWNARDYLSGKKILVDNALKIVKDRSGVSNQVVMPRLMYHSAVKPTDNQNAYHPIAFFSEDTHYSLSKTMTMLDIRTFYAEGTEHHDGLCPLEESDGVWPAEVPSHESGAMNLDALAVLVEFFASKGHPIIVCFNYGTTFKGAYDDVAKACNKLRPILQKYDLLEREVHYDEHDYSKSDKRTGFWFHVDGALGASYMPYMEMAFNGGLVDKKGPTFDFRLPMVHSIATSGHKWIGAPYPCGIFMTRTKYRMLPPSIPNVIGTPDSTFAGSRNALSPIFLWDYIARTSYEDQIFKAIRLDQLAVYAENRLLELQEEVLQEDLYVERTPLGLTVRFKRASDEICLKYTLSNEDLDGHRYSHIFMMEHVTHKLIDALIEDLSKPGAFAEEAKVAITPVTTHALLAPKARRHAHLPSQGRGFR